MASGPAARPSSDTIYAPPAASDILLDPQAPNSVAQSPRLRRFVTLLASYPARYLAAHDQRATGGELPGEASAVAAFRSNQGRRDPDGRTRACPERKTGPGPRVD